MSKKILVADDDKPIRQASELFLGSRGYDVITVDNGRDAVTAAVREHPDIAILDVMMPEKSGFEVCQELKENPDTKDMYILIFSGTVDEVEKGFDYGADDCVAKPVDWNKLVERIEQGRAR